MTNAGAIYRHFEAKAPKPQKGALRIWWIPQVPGNPFIWPVADLAQASSLLNAFAAYDDFQLAHRIKPDYCNAGGLEVFDGEAWFDWESDDGDDFDHWRRQSEVA